MSSLTELRKAYHRSLCAELLAYRHSGDVPNIADVASKSSIEFAKGLVQKLGFDLATVEATPQKIGQKFAELTKDFLSKAFQTLKHLRPGTWIVSTSQAGQGIAAYDQYEHLARLQAVLADKPDLKTALGGDYIITPDIIIARRPEPDEVINVGGCVVQQDGIGSLAPLRERNVANPKSILHASISCKWTMRSDRAQNTRTEALNLIRNRKGNTPHIVAVTFEPMPSRLASIALGTGDLDCAYHVALPELREAVEESCRKNDRDDSAIQLRELIEGRRLRDISDLPLDLAI